MMNSNKSDWPKDVGIHAMELYFPPQYVDQEELEKYDKVSSGKYTVGLGQSKMGFCTDMEDINSLCLTAVKNMFENFNIPPSEIGRLEVGTETLLDKSKSVKTVLMQLFEECGNFSVEGIDTINACYGGTAALFNAIDWIESSYWDGRYALVVAADIAVYAAGNARPTGGAGAVAMLLKPNAPIVFERGLRSVYIRHAYDFYKPNMSSEYPIVDGKLSVQCYLSALDYCYQKFKEKFSAVAKKNGVTEQHFTLKSADAFVFHSPYCKLVQKSLARLLLSDIVHDCDRQSAQNHTNLQKYKNVDLAATYFDKDLEKQLMNASKVEFEEKTQPSLLLASQIGNMYTPSLYGCLASHLCHHETAAEVAGQRIVLFSYGSGLASAMFSVRVTKDISQGSALHQLMARLSHLRKRLGSRRRVSPEDFSAIMLQRETSLHQAPYKPTSDPKELEPGTYYLVDVDDKHRRTYNRTPPAGMDGGILAG